MTGVPGSSYIRVRTRNHTVKKRILPGSQFCDILGYAMARCGQRNCRWTGSSARKGDDPDLGRHLLPTRGMWADEGGSPEVRVRRCVLVSHAVVPVTVRDGYFYTWNMAQVLINPCDLE